MAVADGHTEVVKELVRAGANVNAYDKVCFKNGGRIFSGRYLFSANSLLILGKALWMKMLYFSRRHLLSCMGNNYGLRRVADSQTTAYCAGV